nr:PREDICTED: uncharacterized protein LOC108202161 isoform X2 [Daucus carota subsp. sativus]
MYQIFFSHFQCARSGQFSWSSGKNGKYTYNVVQLPAADELSVQLLYEKFITAASKITMWRRLRAKNSERIFHWIDGMKHTTHEGHHLELMSSNDQLRNLQTDDNTLLLCDGCAQPIRTDQFYGCVVCKYFLHKFCGELPKEIKHHLDPGSASMHSEPYKLFYCYGCGDFCNGIFFKLGYFNFHIGCMALPERIKHESHRHQLEHILDRHLILLQLCKGCGRNIKAKHICSECDYYICGSCVMKPSVVNTHGILTHSA